jgi:nitroreductase
MPAVFERRSVRGFLSRPVEPEKIDRILRAAFEAPSAHNRRPWEFIVITAEEDRKAVAAMSPYAKMLPKAAVAIVPCVNLRLGKSQDPQDVWWVQDLSAATENILLQICDEGLGGVWLGWYPDESRVNAFSARFGLPVHIIPFSVVALGYPVRAVKAVSRFDPSLVHYGAYGKKRE